MGDGIDSRKPLGPQPGTLRGGGRARRRCIFSQMNFFICTATTMKVDTQ
jgi:hypothetical protein